MKHELPFYMAATQGFTVDHSDATAFTTKVLKWWANADKYPRGRTSRSTLGCDFSASATRQEVVRGSMGCS